MIMGTRHIAATHIARLSVLTGAFLLGLTATSEARLEAFSLSVAQSHGRTGQRADLATLGGLRHVVGAVVDDASGDLIVVGDSDESWGEPLRLDDLAVALRALYLHRQAPLVSLDRVDATTQVVRIEGGIADTRFGADLLAADVVLKRVALGILPTQVWGFDSYFDRSLRRAIGGGADLRTRFWFHPAPRAVLAVRDGVLGIEGVGTAVSAQLVAVDGTANAALSSGEDADGEAFARDLADHMPDLRAAHLAVARLQGLFEVVALAQGLQAMVAEHDLEYWLHRHPVERRETPRHLPLTERSNEVETAHGRMWMVMDGGIALEGLLLRLRDGDVTALRQAVLDARPSPDALSWLVPVEAWQMPDDAGAAETQVNSDPEFLAARRRLEEKVGTTVEARVLPLGATAAKAPMTWRTVPSTSVPALHQPTWRDRLSAAPRVGGVGGVLLSGVAVPADGSLPQIDLSSGGFGLVVSGANARLARDAMRRFVTALWAVAFSKDEVGVSIDPIAPDVDKHLVRYIGNVANSDLGRVMREADYLMKKWAVGIETPNFPGFRSVDALSARTGLLVGVSRRFWFVPEDMRFSRAEHLLVFDSGEMRLKTEILDAHSVRRATEADSRFATFFTQHYAALAERYPVFAELREYATLVSLAKYLRDSQVPLLWFMLANHDLILTEDAPGVVDELVKDSDVRRGITIRGGVDFGHAARYVFDGATQAALQRAAAASSSPGGEAAAPTTLPVSFATARGAFTVLPRVSMTAGIDRRGRRYQTDLALRRDGLPSLELVRTFSPRGNLSGEFGADWRLLVPYRVRPDGPEQQTFRNASIPRAMRVENLLSGKVTTMTFSEERYAIAGYVPADDDKGVLLGLFLTSSGSFRLIDRLGNEFWLDGAGDLTAMHLGRDFHMEFDYAPVHELLGGPGALRLAVAGDARLERWGANVPAELWLEDVERGKRRRFRFDDGGDIAGYAPLEAKAADFIALLSDGTFRWEGKGVAVDFGVDGALESVRTEAATHGIRRVRVGEAVAELHHALDCSGHLVVARVTVSDGAEHTMRRNLTYVYTAEGKLAEVSSSAEGRGDPSEPATHGAVTHGGSNRGSHHGT